jgi:hypothetical protein
MGHKKTSKKNKERINTLAQQKNKIFCTTLKNQNKKYNNMNNILFFYSFKIFDYLKLYFIRGIEIFITSYWSMTLKTKKKVKY